jgi:hypothetical protein
MYAILAEFIGTPTFLSYNFCYSNIHCGGVVIGGVGNPSNVYEPKCVGRLFVVSNDLFGCLQTLAMS